MSIKHTTKLYITISIHKKTIFSVRRINKTAERKWVEKSVSSAGISYD